MLTEYVLCASARCYNSGMEPNRHAPYFGTLSQMGEMNANQMISSINIIEVSSMRARLVAE